MRSNYSSNILPSGDIAFSYNPDSISVAKLSGLYALNFLLMAVLLIVIGHFRQNWMLGLTIIPIVTFILTYRATNIQGKNRKIEENGIMDVMTCDIISSYISNVEGKDCKCLRRRYIVGQTDKYGEFERFVLAYLSNKKVVKFKVVQRKGGKDCWNFTIRVTPENIEDSRLINVVEPIKDRISAFLNPEKNHGLAIVLYLFLWLLAVSCFIIPYYLNNKLFMYVVWGYLFLVLIMKFIGKWVAYPNWVIQAILLPNKLIDITTALCVPVFLFAMGVAVFLFMGGVCAGVLYVISLLVIDGGLNWNQEYAIFLYVTSFSIISVYANSWIQLLFIRADFLRSVGEKSLESPMLGFVEYVFQKENINCLIYMAYLVFIFFAAVKLFICKEQPYLISTGIDMAVTKAFLVHIAFTNMIVRRKELKLNTKGIIEYIYSIMSQK